MQEYGNKDIMGMHIFLLVLYSKLNNSIIIRIITGATERSNINSMYEDLGWVSLSRRHLKHRLTLFYKITNKMTPQYLADIVPPTVGDRQIYNLRSRDNISQIHAQKQRYTKSFFPATIR